jgi:hypothetical protein
MDEALVIASTSTTNNNTKDALVDSSPPGAQSDDDDVEIVGLPPAIEERPQEKHKSNDGGQKRTVMSRPQEKRESNNGGDGQQGKQKKQKHTAITKNHQKRPAISDADLEKQVNWVRQIKLLYRPGDKKQLMYQDVTV